MVVAHTLELTGLTVKLKSMLRCIRDTPNTEARLYLVQQLRLLIYSRPRYIQIRCLGTPELRLFDGRFAFLSLDSSNHLSLIKYIGLYSVFCILYSNRLYAILQLHLYRYRSLVLFNFRSPYQHAEGRYMNRVRFYQMYVSVQTGTRVPTALLRFVL